MGVWEPFLGIVAAQIAFAGLVAWLWDRNDRRWKHLTKRMRHAVTVGAAVLMPHMLLTAYVVTKVSQRLARRGRVYAALMDMQRRMKERGAGEKCPRCGEYHF